jgi:hypothetical protein
MYEPVALCGMIAMLRKEGLPSDPITLIYCLQNRISVS